MFFVSDADDGSDENLERANGEDRICVDEDEKAVGAIARRDARRRIM